MINHIIVGEQNKKGKNDMSRKKNKNFIDFNTLTNFELHLLSTQWENEARIFEAKLDSIKRKPNVSDKKIEYLWDVGKKLWRKVVVLEEWKKRNNKY